MFSAVIVEDNTATANMIAQVIRGQEAGFQIKAVLHDGQQGKEALLLYRPDLIIADINMPGLDGLNMVESCRQFLPNSLVIFITAYSEFRFAHHAIKLHAFDFLLKPFTREEVGDIVRRAGEELRKAARLQAKRMMDGEEQADLPLLLWDIRRHLEEHMEQQITLEQLSRQFGVSASHIGKLIRQHTGKRYAEFVTDLRIAYAKKLLLNPCYRVEEVSGMVGYQNYVTFYKVFTRAEGVSPTAYRNGETQRQTRRDPRQ